MTRLSARLREFIEPSKNGSGALLPEERRVYRSMKTESTRAVKGRRIRDCRFDGTVDGTTARLVVSLSGNDASCVARQVARRFDEMSEVASSDVEKDGSNFNVVVCMERKQ